jgi:hypothetical protein
MVIFENRNGVNFLVHEYRKRRKVPFAGHHGVNLDTPYVAGPSPRIGGTVNHLKLKEPAKTGLVYHK